MEKFLEYLKSLLKDEVIGDEKIMKELSETTSKLITDTVPGLVENKETILKEKKMLSEKFTQLEKDFNTYKDTFKFFEENKITPVVYNELLEQKNKLEAQVASHPDDMKKRDEEQFLAGKKAYEAEIKSKLEALEAKASTYSEKEQTWKNKYVSSSVEKEIQKMIVELNLDVDKYWVNGLKSSAQVSYDENEDKISIAINTGSGTMPLNDWKNWYPTTEEGKRFVKAPDNAGGGASGGTGSGNGNSSGGEQRVSAIETYKNLFPDA